MKPVAGILLFAAMTLHGFAKDTSISLPMSPSEAITFRYSDPLVFNSWNDPEDGYRQSLQFRVFPSGRGVCSQFFRIIVETDPEGIVGRPGATETFVRAMAQAYLSGSEEKACNVQLLKRATGTACYCILTDADMMGVQKTEKQYYRYITFGVITVGNKVLT